MDRSSSAKWLIEGADGVDIGGAGTVTNWGTIKASNTYGVFIGEGGSVINGSASATGRLIEAARDGVAISGAAGTVSNFGTIAGTLAGGSGVLLAHGGTVNNGASGSTGWLIAGGAYGVRIFNGSGTVNNFGTIIGTSYAGVDEAASRPGDQRTKQRGELVDRRRRRNHWSTVPAPSRTGARSRPPAPMVCLLAKAASVTNGNATATGRLIEAARNGVAISGAVGTVSNFGIDRWDAGLAAGGVILASTAAP